MPSVPQSSGARGLDRVSGAATDDSGGADHLDGDARPLAPLPRDLPIAPQPIDAPNSNRLNDQSSLRRVPPVDGSLRLSDGAIQLVSYQSDTPSVVSDSDAADAGGNSLDNYKVAVNEAPIQPIPAEYWNALPPSCLQHMLGFESVKQEYERSSSANPAASPPAQSDADTVALSRLIQLARQNSREYQTEKKRLYVAAIGVSLERFASQLKFSPFGNGSAVNYTHDRVNGTTVNSLGVPTGFQMERMLATGGNFVTRFANDVLLTFNGPQGFTSDVSSELFFELTQSFLQRDILLEPLISSERALVYSARTFARFRKEFFFDVASQYYGILRTYRSIEINSQNYFALVRTVERAQAEVATEVKNAPNQVAVDQFEQSMLSGRSNLIQVCNDLERDLDRLKLTLGLPTEYRIRIDLDELERLTRLDQTEVAVERVRRWRRRVINRRNQSLVNRMVLINDDFFMLERVLEWLEQRQEASAETAADSATESSVGANAASKVKLDPALRELYLFLLFEQTRNNVERIQAEYDRASDPQIVQPPIFIYLRATELIESRLSLIDLQLRYLTELKELSIDQLQRRRDRYLEVTRQIETAREVLANNPNDDQLNELFVNSRTLLTVTEQLIRDLDEALGYDPARTNDQKDREALEVTDRLLALVNELSGATGPSLPEVDINVDDAMLTALIQRLDMMNERGFLADDWRRMKLASDDLRSVLNLSASHSLRTDKNQPFDFDFDDSRTQLRVSLDLPFNRRSQRNRFRSSLINYQAGRRSVMQLEDSIKFDVRNGLRSLELTRVQYPISVTQAALAAEQVISIRLQLALGTPNVRGTDLLDALQGSRQALTSVANSRIDYLVDRARFVLDLELMQVDENGFWPQINDPTYQPAANLVYPPNAGPTYGTLSPCVKPSRLLRHIYGHPLPGEAIELREQSN